jgi:hypothetical protein
VLWLLDQLSARKPAQDFRTMHNTSNTHSATTPDTVASALQSLDNIIAFARERAAVGEIHDAIIGDAIKYLEGVKKAFENAQ